MHAFSGSNKHAPDPWQLWFPGERAGSAGGAARQTVVPRERASSVAKGPENMVVEEREDERGGMVPRVREDDDEPGNCAFEHDIV